MEERIARLPKWAQHYIDKLESDIAYYKEQSRQVSTGDSPITWGTYLDSMEGKAECGIPATAKVNFHVIGGTIETYLERGMLHIRTTGSRLPASVGECANGLRFIVIGWDQLREWEE